MSTGFVFIFAHPRYFLTYPVINNLNLINLDQYKSHYWIWLNKCGKYDDGQLGFSCLATHMKLKTAHSHDSQFVWVLPDRLVVFSCWVSGHPLVVQRVTMGHFLCVLAHNMWRTVESQDIHSAPKALKKQGQFFCFCNTLNTSGFEIERWKWNRSEFRFVVFTYLCDKQFRTPNFQVSQILGADNLQVI